MRLKTTILCAIFGFLIALPFSRISAQPGIGISYTVSQPKYQVPNVTLGTYTTIVAANDDSVSRVHRPAGFSFIYGGLTYDGIVASSNGWVGLIRPVANGGAATTTYVAGLTSGPANNLANHTASIGVSGIPVLAPLWDDLNSAVAINYTAPNLTVRWNTVRWDKTSASTTTNFAMILNTSTNTFQFSYTNVLAPTNPSASVGITGPCSGDYYSWKVAADFSIATSAASGPGVNTLTFGSVAGLTTGMLVYNAAPALTLSAAAAATNTLTFASTTGAQVGMYANHPLIPAGATVTAVTATTITISGAPVTIPATVQINFSYYPQGTTISSIVGNTLTLSNPKGATVNVPLGGALGTFRFLSVPTIDSTLENNIIGQGCCPRPTNYYIEWSASTPWNDGCNGSLLTAGTFTPNLGTVGGTCTAITAATTHATSGFFGNMGCQATDNRDVWFTLTKPIGVANFIVRTAAAACNSVSGTSIEVFAGANCASLGAPVCATTNIANSNSFGEIVINGNACVSQNYFVRVTGDNNEVGKFTICAVQDNSGSTCANAITVPSLPFTSNCLTTTGFVNDYNNNGCNTGYAGADLVFEYTVTATECIDISMTSITAGSNPGIFVFNGCPGVGTCVGSATGTGTSLTLSSLTLAPGTYYFIIDNTTGSIANFNLTIGNSANTIPANDDPCGATVLSTPFSCTYVNASTFCATPTTAGSPAVPACGSYSGNADVWFQATVPASGVVNVTVAAGSAPSMTDPVVAIYTGTCAALGTIVACSDDVSGLFPAASAGGLIPGSTIWIRVWPKTGSTLGNFQICATTCNPPPYDNCSGAFGLGTPSSGICSFTGTYTTSCAQASAGAPVPSCGNYSGGDVWFTVTVPASGIVNINSQPAATGTPMGDGAMAVYTGTCGALTEIACATNGSSFNAAFPAINLSGRTPGSTLYVRVWSENNATPGTFQLCTTTACNANDEPCSALPITVSVGAPVFGTFNNTCATTSCGIPSPTCATTGLSTIVILNGGSGYAPSTTYTGVQISGGTGTGATVNVTTNGAGVVTTVTVNATGFNYNNPTCWTGGLVAGTGTPALPAVATPASLQFGSARGAEDIWLSVVVPPSGTLTITGLVGTMTDPVMSVYTGTCGSLTHIGCNDDGGPGLAPELNFCSSSGLISPGQTLYIRIWPYSRFTPDGTFQLAAYDPATGVPNPYQQDNPCSITQNFPVTFGTCNTYTTMSLRCYTPTTSATYPSGVIPDPTQCWPLAGGGFGSNGWNPSNDLWVRVIVPASVTGMNFLTVAGTEGDDNMAVYRSTNCSTLTQLGCDDLNGPGLMPYLSLGGLIPGETLYVRHYPWNGGTTRQGDFGFCVEAACTTVVPNDDPCTSISLPVNSGCIYGGPYTTSCGSVTSQVGLPNPSCGAFTLAGVGATRDVWFTVTVPASGQLTIDIRSINIADAAMAVYSLAGACSTGTYTQVACDDNSSANSAMPYLYLTGQTPGATLYVRVWGKNGGTGQFEVCVTDPCPSGIPANDLPCNAISMTVGTTYVGYNSCSTGGAANGETMTYPACWTLGNPNTVWYSFIAPASGSVNITTQLGTLTNTQIALYQGSFCFSLIPYSGTNCNDDYLQCGVGTTASQILATGLVPGQTYYIAVDGKNNLTGTFSITVYDGSASLPAVAQQDCPLGTLICSQSTTFGAPGFIGSGNICDLGPGGTAYGCAPATGRRENNSAFFYFTASGTGLLSFTISPSLPSANYDWMLWDITSYGTAPLSLGAACSDIRSNTAPVLACNYDSSSASSVTGMGGTGTCTFCTSGQGVITQEVLITTGSTYLLMINNANGAPAGFTLDFSPTAPVAYVAANPLNWSGGTNSNWDLPANWGGCGSPNCANGANVLAGFNQPVLTGSDTVQNLTINPGANITLTAGANLYICGNFINNGQFNADPTSTVTFIGTGPQNIVGNFTGTSRFGNLVINKPSGQVNINTTIVEVAGNFNTANATSILNMNGRTLRVMRNFSNFAGNTTIIGVAGSTLEFTGGVPQTFTNLGSNLTLNNVTINQSPASSVTLAANPTSNLITGTSGILTLTNGRFITGATNEVVVTNTATGGATNGNNNSYVDGWLRRYFGTSAIAYNFGVGEPLTGYQRYELVFTTAPSAPYNLAVRFLRWGGANLTNPAGGPVPPPLECAKYDWSLRQPLNHGYWNTSCSTPTPTGTYNLTLWNRSYTNYNQSNSTAYPISTAQGAPGTVLTFTSTAGLAVGMFVQGDELNPGVYPTIVAITPTTVTLSSPTLTPAQVGTYYAFFQAGAPARFDALTIMHDTTSTGGWKMDAICPCNNTNPPPPKPNSMRYAYDASIHGFTNFATVQFGTVLPIELISFTADQTNEGNLCKWATASETNNDYFELQRSYDGETFATIGTVPGYGAGTTSETHEYSFMDTDPCNGIVYYRLRQVDIDLNSSESDVVALNCMRSKEDFVLFPNPASDQLTYSFFENSDGIVDVEFIDMMGKVVKWERFNVTRGYNSLRSQLNDLAAGVYFLKMQRMDMTGESRMVRFTKK